MRDIADLLLLPPMYAWLRQSSVSLRNAWRMNSCRAGMEGKGRG